jgi:hypothetical protein
MATHLPNTDAMLTSLRCGARTRAGNACMSPAIRGKKRCRMHGGAQGSGAPRGNTNALKHGGFTREAIKRRRQIRELIRGSHELLKKLK